MSDVLALAQKQLDTAIPLALSGQQLVIVPNVGESSFATSGAAGAIAQLATPQDWSANYQYNGEQPLAPARPNGTSTDWLGANNPLSKWISSASDSMANTARKVTPWWLSLTGPDVVTIIIGILLIAAGIFAFKQTQIIIERGAKIAAKVGALSA